MGILALGIVAGGFFLPSTYHVERTARIEAPAARVYDHVADPRQWAMWSAWNRRDPAMDISYSGPPFGQGARWSWKSETEGSGSMEFTRVEPNRRVEYALDFHDFNMKSTGAFAIDESGGATTVTWSSTGDVGPNPLRHYLAWGMDRMVGPDFEQGLANLKALAERP